LYPKYEVPYVNFYISDIYYRYDYYSYSVDENFSRTRFLYLEAGEYYIIASRSFRANVNIIFNIQPVSYVEMQPNSSYTVKFSNESKVLQSFSMALAQIVFIQ